MYGQANISYNGASTESTSSGSIAGAANGDSVSTIDPTIIVLGQDVGQVGAPARLLSNREIPLNGFNAGTSGAGTVVIGASLTNQVPPAAGIAVFFGDSITVGTNASPTSNSWVNLVCGAYGFAQSNLGLSGTYLENQVPIQPNNMVTRIGAIPLKTPAHSFLFFAYGINDVDLNAPNYTTANLTTDYTTVLNAALAQGWTAGSIILIGTSYRDPASYTSVLGFPPATQARHLAFNAAIQAVAATFTCTYIDVYTVMQAQGGAALLLPDTLHPNNGGHRIMAQQIINALKVHYTNGQALLVNGIAEFSNIRLDNNASLATPIAVLGMDGAGNVAPTNALVGNTAQVNMQAVFGNGAAVAADTVDIYGTTQCGYIKLSGFFPAGMTGKAMHMGLVGAFASINCYDFGATAPFSLYLNSGGGQIVLGGVGSRVGMGGITPPTAMLDIPFNSGGAAGFAPLKFHTSPLMGTPEDGAFEYNGANLFYSVGAVRYVLAKTLTATAALDFPNTLTLTSSDLTIALTGAADGDIVSLGVPIAAQNANSCYAAFVSAPNVVTVRFNNYSALAIDPAVGNFRVSVLKY